MSLLFVLIGFVVMVFGAEYFVKGAVNIAARLGIPPLVIGLTIVAWGTSMPELAVSLGAASQDAAGLAVGNVIGSNIANVLLIGGVAALIIPLCCAPKQLRREALMLAGATVFACGIGLAGFLSPWMGVALLALLLGQTLLIYRAVASGKDEALDLLDEVDANADATALWKAGLFFAAGLAAVIIGSELLVHGAIELAEQLEVPDAIIGVSLVAVGTSLPELVTSIAAARQGQRDVIVGNIVGSNVANIVLVLGVVAMAAPGAIPLALLDGDLLVMAISSALFVGLLMLGKQLGRWWGLGFLVAYGAYIVWQFEFFGLM